MLWPLGGTRVSKDSRLRAKPGPAQEGTQLRARIQAARPLSSASSSSARSPEVELLPPFPVESQWACLISSHRQPHTHHGHPGKKQPRRPADYCMSPSEGRQWALSLSGGDHVTRGGTFSWSVSTHSWTPRGGGRGMAQPSSFLSASTRLWSSPARHPHLPGGGPRDSKSPP